MIKIKSITQIVLVSFFLVSCQHSETSGTNPKNANCFMDKDSDGCTSVSPISNKKWAGWKERRFSFGFMPFSNKTYETPFMSKTYTISNGTIICGGNQDYLRWGYHVFEGYAADSLSRITLLVNKHNEEGKPLAEMYYYLTEYNHSEKAYGFVRVGSDVKDHSFLFGRDKFIAFGESDFRSIIELASIDPQNDINPSCSTIEDADEMYNPESMSLENSKCVLYITLKNARDGAMFYDNLRGKIVVKENGHWCDVVTSPCPEGTYKF